MPSDSMFGKDAETLLHEIQHVIQKAERSSGGANLKYWNDRMEEGYSKQDFNLLVSAYGKHKNLHKM